MRNIISSGELNDELLIQRNSAKGELNDYGFPVSEVIETVADLYCKVKTVSTREYIAANRESSSLVYKFIVLRDDIPEEISNEMYITYNGKRWDIKHIHFMDDYHFEITAELYK